jgi:hypothetical protein
MMECFFEAIPSYVDFYVDLYQALLLSKSFHDPNEAKKQRGRKKSYEWKFPRKDSE